MIYGLKSVPSPEAYKRLFISASYNLKGITSASFTVASILYANVFVKLLIAESGISAIHLPFSSR